MTTPTSNLELLRTWQEGDFRLDLFYVETDRWCRVRLAYEFSDRGEIIFTGDEFYPSPLYSYDDDEAVESLLSFLALQPGDTDQEYFDDYTDRQLAWVKERSEELRMVVYDTLPCAD